MEVSVIIPVYNAEKFIERAAKSALKQPETKEVILIDDGSTDRSADICRELADNNERIIFFQHAGQRNLGPGATRNVGLKNASCEYIAFLDADDFYVENRFATTRQIFAENKIADGIYELVIRYDNSNKSYQKNTGHLNTLHSYQLSETIQPEQLLEKLITSDTSLISLDGLTLKKRVLKKTGFFDVKLKQGEDTDFIWRLSANIYLVPGEQNKPVTYSELHGGNKTLELKEVIKMKHLLYEKWFNMIPKNNWSKKMNRKLTNNFLYYHPVMKPFQNVALMRVTLKIIMLSYWIFRQPKMLIKLL